MDHRLDEPKRFGTPRGQQGGRFRVVPLMDEPEIASRAPQTSLSAIRASFPEPRRMDVGQSGFNTNHPSHPLISQLMMVVQPPLIPQIISVWKVGGLKGAEVTSLAVMRLHTG